MDYQVRITVGRYRRARDFLSDLAQLKAFRGEYAGPTLLESLEELGLLPPRIRLYWPDPTPGSPACKVTFREGRLRLNKWFVPWADKAPSFRKCSVTYGMGPRSGGS